MSGRPGPRARRRTTAILCAAAFALGPSCQGPVEPELTDGELIRQLLEIGSDESILFSSALLADPSGTTSFERTIDSVKRGFRNFRFYDDVNELQSTRLAFEARVEDTLYGTIRFDTGGGSMVFPYAQLVYGGNAKFLKLGSTSVHPNPWYIRRMQYRKMERLSGNGSPVIQTMLVTHDGVTHSVATSVNVLIMRDSVLTLDLNALSSVSVTVLTQSADDSFFVTYPVAGSYATAAMEHTDSSTHQAQVQVQSARRYELLTVQGFKRSALLPGDTSDVRTVTARSAILAFR